MDKMPLRIALDAPEMEIWISKEENDLLRGNASEEVKSAILIRAIKESFMQIGANAKVWIGYDDIDVDVNLKEDYKYN